MTIYDYFDRLTSIGLDEEISEELEMPIGTVKAQLFRSRKQLFKILSGKKDIF